MQWYDPMKTSKMLFHQACPYHGPTLQKNFQGQPTNCKTKYGKWKCMDCAHIVRSYCLCTPGLMYCTGCYGNHCADVAGDKKGST